VNGSSGKRKKPEPLIFDGEFLRRQRALQEIASHSLQSGVYLSTSFNASPAVVSTPTTRADAADAAVSASRSSTPGISLRSLRGTRTSQGPVTGSTRRMWATNGSALPDFLPVRGDA
jgi:hypothetical protein